MPDAICPNCGRPLKKEGFDISPFYVEDLSKPNSTEINEKFEELTDEERVKIFNIVNKTITILRNNNICDRFNIIFEEKEGRHFHIWIMPRHKWMSDMFEDITDNIGEIFAFAKNNFRDQAVYNKIKEIKLGGRE